MPPPALPERQRQDQSQLIANQRQAMLDAFVDQPPVMPGPVRRITDDVVHLLGDAPHIPHLTEPALNEVTAPRWDASFQTYRRDRADAAARIKHFAHEGFGIKQ
jgi:hypothetical protein